MTISDEQLILEVRTGSGEAFTELFQRYRQPIYAFFRRRLENPARAEELAQETFIAVLRGAVRYEPRALFRTYLYSIALNLVMAERRKAGHETGVSSISEHQENPKRADIPEQTIFYSCVNTKA